MQLGDLSFYFVNMIFITILHEINLIPFIFIFHQVAPFFQVRIMQLMKSTLSPRINYFLFYMYLEECYFQSLCYEYLKFQIPQTCLVHSWRPAAS